MSTLPVLMLTALTCGASPDAFLLDFTAKWCTPCQQMSPIVSRLHRQGHPIFAVDVDQRPDLVKKYGISTIPAFVLVIDGKVARRIVGSTSENELQRMLALIPPKQPEVPDTLPNAPLFAKTSQNPRGSTLSQTRAAPVAKPAARFQLPFISRNSGEKQPLEETTRPLVVRAKIDDEAVLTGQLPDISPMAVSTRIRISDKDSVNFGSGTIIDSRVGVTRILTCGHIFRKLAKDALIEVDVFLDDKKRTYVGKPLRYDMNADVGLIVIPTDAILPAMRVAPVGYRVEEGMKVQSVGCGGGEDPTLQNVSVLTVNRYRGPATLECTNVPQQGRSGGGLFASEGYVIGVCTAAIPDEKRGLYAGLKAIQDLLDDCQLSELYDVPSRSTNNETYLAATENSPASDRLAEEDQRHDNSRHEQQFADASFDQRPELDPADFDAPDLEPASVRIPATEAPRSADVFAAAERETRVFEQTINPDDEDLEVICVIRKKGAPSSTNRVVVFDKPTTEFVDFLTRRSAGKNEPTMTSLQVTTQDRSARTESAKTGMHRPSSTASVTRWADRPIDQPGGPKATTAKSGVQRYRRQR